jgi:glycine hydroxymethyltransferase
MPRLKHYLSKTAPDQQKSSVIAHLAALDHLENTSPEIASAIVAELEDQRSHLKLIASENYSSLGVQLAMGNWLTDKYAEGYPFHRFYAGCEHVDAIEERGKTLAERLFQAEHAYIQPHSGADANLIAFLAILIDKIQSPLLEKWGKKGVDELTKDEHEQLRDLLVHQKILGMSLNSGGHLTHGFRMNLSSKLMQAIHYEVDPGTEQLDYKKIEEQAVTEKPLILLAGYSAYSRKIDFAKMREIADKAGSVLMVDMAHFAGLVAGRVFEGPYNPIPYAHIVTSTTHKTLRGPRGGLILCKKELAPFVDKGCPLAMGGPLPHVMAAKAVAFEEALQPSFQTYSKKIVENAKALGESFQKRGVRPVSGGTDNHLLVLDISSFGLNGRQAESALREASITTSRNTVPYDKKGPWYTSGIRVGTPALTTLGLGTAEMDEIADMMVDVLKNARGGEKSQYVLDPATKEKTRERVLNLLRRFPLYPELVLE